MNAAGVNSLAVLKNLTSLMHQSDMSRDTDSSLLQQNMRGCMCKGFVGNMTHRHIV